MCHPQLDSITNTGVLIFVLRRHATESAFSDINIFSFSRSFTRGQVETDKPHFRDIWTEKTYLTTEESFPTVLRRSEVIELHVVEISPLETALTDVETRNKELSMLEAKYTTLAKTSTNVPTTALAMALNAAVDTPPESGIPVYRDAFFRPEYIARNPSLEPQLQQLKDAIDEQVSTISEEERLCAYWRFQDSHYRPLLETPWRAVRSRDDEFPGDLDALLPNEFPR